MALSKTGNMNQVESNSIIASKKQYDAIKMGVHKDDMWVVIDRMTELYPNAGEATSREILSNACDATILLPKDERLPIKVTTPSLFNSTFTVQDFGVGMSFETLKDVYANYGRSTKRTDFTQIGAFGLGAKAPLAYCSEFFITTTHDGVTIYASVKRTETGNEVQPLDITETGDHSGTTISIPVKESDIGAFRGYLENYRQFASDDYQIEIDGTLVENQSSAYIEMGNFCLDEEADVWGRVWARRKYLTGSYVNDMIYQMRPSIAFNLSGWMYKEEHPSYYSKDKENFVIELKPGVVNFASSRDSIKFDQRYHNLVKRFNEKYMNASVETFSKAIEVYRAMEPSEGVNFLSNLFSKKFLQFNDEKGNISFTTYGNTAKFDVSLSEADFVMDNGYRPLDFFKPSAGKPKNLYADVTLGGNGGFFVVNGCAEVKDGGRNVYQGSPNLTTVARRNDALIQALDAEATALDNAVIFNGESAINSMGYTLQADAKNMEIVYGVDGDFMEEFIKRRTLLERYGYSQKRLIFTKRKATKAEVERYKKIGLSIEQISAKDFSKRFEEVKEKRREEAKEKAKKAPKCATFKGAYYFKDNLDELGKSFSRSGVLLEEELNLDEAIANGDIVVVVAPYNRNGFKDEYRAKRFAQSALIGILNHKDDGKKALGRKVHVADVHNLNAAAFDKLKDYEFAFLDSEANYKCNAFEEMAKTRRRSGKELLAEILDATKKDLLWGVISSAHPWANSRSLSRLANYFPEDSMNRTILETVNGSDYHFSEEVLKNSAFVEDVKDKVGDEMVNAAMKLRDALKKVEGDSVAFKVFNEYFYKERFSRSAAEDAANSEMLAVIAAHLAAKIEEWTK